MKNIEDFENEEIVLMEYLGTYDWWLSFKVNKTWEVYHRSGYKILCSTQLREYGPMYFECSEWKEFINLTEVWSESG